jgi:hypothetical protein
MQPFLSRGALFDLAARDDVQSRLVIQQAASAKQPWRLRHGPFARRGLPPFKQPGWTLLPPNSPAIWVLDNLPGWQRFYADDVAVVHRRIAADAPTGNAQPR